MGENRGGGEGDSVFVGGGVSQNKNNAGRHVSGRGAQLPQSKIAMSALLHPIANKYLILMCSG